MVRIQAEDARRWPAPASSSIPAALTMTAYAVGGESRDIIVESDQTVTRRTSGCRCSQWHRHPTVDGSDSLAADRDSDELKMASPVITIGYRCIFSVTPTFGMIGGFDLHLNQYQYHFYPRTSPRNVARRRTCPESEGSSRRYPDFSDRQSNCLLRSAD